MYAKIKQYTKKLYNIIKLYFKKSIKEHEVLPKVYKPYIRTLEIEFILPLISTNFVVATDGNSHKVDSNYFTY